MVDQLLWVAGCCALGGLVVGYALRDGQARRDAGRWETEREKLLVLAVPGFKPAQEVQQDAPRSRTWTNASEAELERRQFRVQ